MKRNYKKRVLSSTAVKGKKHLLRSLDTFTQKNYAIYLDTSDLELDLEPYINKDTNKKKLKAINLIFESHSKLKLYSQNKIYDESLYKKDIKDYVLIEDTIDNLISINRKTKYKQELKKILEITTPVLFKDKTKRESDFLIKDIKVIELIRLNLDVSQRYAVNLYSQIRRRVKYKNTGLYIDNDTTTINANIIRPKYITDYELTLEKIKYLVKNEWLFTKSICDELRKRIKDKKIFEYPYSEKNDINDEWHSFYKDEASRYISDIKTSRQEEVNDIAIKLYLEYIELEYYKVFTPTGGVVDSNKYIRNIRKDLIENNLDKKHITEFLRIQKNKWKLLNTNIDLIKNLSDNVDLFDWYGESKRDELEKVLLFDLDIENDVVPF